MSFGKDRRTLLAVFIVLLIAFEMIAYVSTTPRQQQRFFQLFVLGANHMAADYYPNNDPNIRLGESVLWYIGVTNLMGNAQLAVVRIKLGNWTITPPNDLRGTPSPAPLLAEFTRFRAIAEYAMLHPPVQGLQDGFGRWEIHVRHPHGDNVRASVPAPFQAVRVPPVHHLVEIEAHIRKPSSCQEPPFCRIPRVRSVDNTPATGLTSS